MRPYRVPAVGGGGTQCMDHRQPISRRKGFAASKVALDADGRDAAAQFFRLHWSVDGRSGLPQALPIPWTLERLKSFIRLITPSPNRGFDVILSAGFTRAISICGKVVLLGLVISMGGNSSVGREEPLSR
jgi:hypothetical protein